MGLKMRAVLFFGPQYSSSSILVAADSEKDLSVFFVDAVNLIHHKFLEEL
jgi:hypothetical protein